MTPGEIQKLLDEGVALLKQTTVGWAGHSTAWQNNQSTKWWQGLDKIGQARKALDVAPAPTPVPTPTPTPSSALTGVCVHLHGTFADMDAKVARYKNAGVQVIRDDFAWAWMETSKGQINWSRTQAICEAAKKHGVKVLPQIGFCPAWANGNAGNDKVGPLNPADFGSFAGRLAGWLHTNYPGLVVGIEPWNEPNIQFLINKTTGKFGDPLQYVQLANAAYDAIHAFSPIPVVAGATAGPGYGWPGSALPGTWDEPVMQWVERVLDLGLKFDEWSCHPYEFGNGNQTAATMLRLTDPTPWARSLWDTRVESLAEQLNRKRGYTGPIHGSEWGCPTNRPDGTPAPRGTSEANQADLMRLGIPLWKSNPRHGHLTVYCADDTNSWGTSTMEEHFGLWRSDATPKPSVAAFTTAARV